MAEANVFSRRYEHNFIPLFFFHFVTQKERLRATHTHWKLFMNWLKRRLIIAAIALAFIGGKYWMREHDRRAQSNQEMDNVMTLANPAIHEMSADHLTGSDWAYSGPLGDLTLRFEPDGKLTVTSGTTTSEGKWEIDDFSLEASIPGSDKRHEAIFHDSTDVLVGVIPSKWSATRQK